ncbi:lipoate--protein ligase [Halobacteriales archaeon SW_7_71_33]|nr:MAG: lipoate--protein ligase [Halobacteriales archaeon SW_7_71_33]
MLLVRDRAATVDADRAVNRRLLAVAAEGRPAVRVARPHRQVAFGRRDTRSDGYGRARRAARERGYPPVERDVGGRAVAYTGSTLAFLRAEPARNRGDIDERYDRATAAVRRALAGVGADLSAGEPPESFCPGSHSLQGSGGKVVGLAQRVRRDAAVTAGIAVVRDDAAVAEVLGPVYDALGVAFDPSTVGSVARAGGSDDPADVRRALEAALVGERPTTTVDAATVEVDADADVNIDPTRGEP